MIENHIESAGYAKVRLGTVRFCVYLLSSTSTNSRVRMNGAIGEVSYVGSRRNDFTASHVRQCVQRHLGIFPLLSTLEIAILDSKADSHECLGFELFQECPKTNNS